MEYPKMVYSVGGHRIIEDENEQNNLGPEWHFDPKLENVIILS